MKIFQENLESMSKNNLDVPVKKMRELLAIEDEQEKFRQIAIWTTEYGWDEIVYTRSPFPPQQLINYRGLGYSQKQKIGQDFFLRNDIKIFIENKWIINSLNWKFLQWLNKIIKWLNPETDMEIIKKVRQKISDFYTAYQKDQERPFWALNPFYEWTDEKKESVQYA